MRFAWPKLAVAAAGVLVFADAACSLAVSFDDQASCDGGLCDDASVATDAAPAIDAGDARDSAVDAAPSKDAAKDAPADVFDESYQPCKGLVSGVYCATDGPKGYRGPSTDLLNCDAGQIYAVQPCGDAGCISMTNPFPDTCNECPEKQNGTYCGRDFPGFPAANADILIGCQAGNVVQNVDCAHGCHSNGSAASCNP